MTISPIYPHSMQFTAACPCRAALRLLILRRCSTRILTDGGATAEALPDARVPASTPEAKARAVYSAFAR